MLRHVCNWVVVHQGLMSGVDMNKANSSSNCCSRFRCAGATSQHLGYRINSHCSPLTILYRPTQPCLDCFASTVLPTNFVTNYRPKGSCQPLFRPWAINLYCRPPGSSLVWSALDSKIDFWAQNRFVSICWTSSKLSDGTDSTWARNFVGTFIVTLLEHHSNFVGTHRC